MKMLGYMLYEGVHLLFYTGKLIVEGVQYLFDPSPRKQILSAIEMDKRLKTLEDKMDMYLLSEKSKV